MYRVIKQSGIPDSQIILMNALDVQCDSRNRYPGHVYDTDQAIPFMRGALYNTQQTTSTSTAQSHSSSVPVTVPVPTSLCDGELEMDYTVSVVLSLMKS